MFTWVWQQCRSTLHAKSKMFGFDMFARLKSLGSGLVSTPNYLWFGVVIRPKMFGSGVILLKRKKILFL